MDFREMVEELETVPNSFSLNNQKKLNEFTYDKKGILKPDEKKGNDDLEEVCNFVPYVREEIIEHKVDGTSRRKITAGIYLKGKPFDPVTLYSTAFSREDWIYNYFPFSCIIYTRYSDVRKFLQYCSKKAIKIHEYQYIGWAQDLNWTFIHAGGIISNETSKNIRLSEGLEKFNICRNNTPEEESLKYLKNTMFEIMPDSGIKIILSFMLLSLVKSKLTFAQPQFVFLIHGKSGSFKTTISKLIFNIFEGYYDTAPMNLSVTTAAAMEEIGLLFRDCVCLYDDIAPASNPTQRAENEAKVDRLCRSTGDGTGRHKMHGSKKRCMKAAGLSAVTAEYVPIDSLSSIARSVILYFDKKEIDLKTLTQAQKEREKYISFITHYINYISKNGDLYIGKLEENFSKACKNFKHLSKVHSRTPYSAAWLWASYKMFIKYANNVIPDLFKKSELQNFEDDLLKLMKSQKEYMAAQDGISIFIDSIKELLATNKITISKISVGENNKNTAVIQQNTIGYSNEDYVYLLPNETFRRVNTFLRGCGKVLPISEASLKKQLYENGKLKINGSKNGGLTIKLSINGNRQRVLKLEKKLFYKSI